MVFLPLIFKEIEGGDLFLKKTTTKPWGIIMLSEPNWIVNFVEIKWILIDFSFFFYGLPFWRQCSLRHAIQGPQRGHLLIPTPLPSWLECKPNWDAVGTEPSFMEFFSLTQQKASFVLSIVLSIVILNYYPALPSEVYLTSGLVCWQEK